MRFFLIAVSLSLYQIVCSQKSSIIGFYKNKPFDNRILQGQLHFSEDSIFSYSLRDHSGILQDTAVGRFKVIRKYLLLEYGQNIPIESEAIYRYDTVQKRMFEIREVKMPYFRFIRPHKLRIKQGKLKYDVYIEKRKRNGSDNKRRIRCRLTFIRM